MKVYYADDTVTLYHGKAEDLLASLDDASVDCVITDPPYDERTHSFARSNSTRNSLSGKGSRVLSGGSTARFEAYTHDVQIELFRRFGEVTRRWVVANVATDTAFRFETEGAPPGLRLLRVGAWIKTNPMPMLAADRPGMGWETFVCLHREDVKQRWNGGGRSINYVGPTVQNTGHPTAKPLPMITDWVRYFTDPGDTILDPFAGTGTTGRAVKDAGEGRKVILCEEREDWCEIVANRLTDTVRAAEGTLFEVSP